MSTAEKYNKISVGAVAGFILPLFAGIIFYLFSTGNRTPVEYIHKILKAGILTHIISLCVLPDLFLFLIFNRLDMLSASKGVLGITIFWAALVFAVKFLL